MSGRCLIEAALVGLSIALITGALAPNQSWWDRHFVSI